MIEQPKVQADPQRPRGQAQRAQHAEAVVPVPGILHGRLSAWSPSATRSGCNMNPLSSRNTTLAFRSRSLFLSAATPAAANAGSPLVPLAGTLLGLLHAPAQLVQQRAHVVHVVGHAEQLLDYFQHPRTGPQLVRVAAGPAPRSRTCGSAVVVVCPSDATDVRAEGPSSSPPRLGLERIAPAFHAAGGRIHGLGDIHDSHLLLQQLDRLTAALLQCSSWTWWSHNPIIYTAHLWARTQ